MRSTKETNKRHQQKRPTNETSRRDLQKWHIRHQEIRPAKETYKWDLRNRHTRLQQMRTTHDKYKWDLHRRHTRHLHKTPTKDTYKRDLQKRPTKETYFIILTYEKPVVFWWVEVSFDFYRSLLWVRFDMFGLNQCCVANYPACWATVFFDWWWGFF